MIFSQYISVDHLPFSTLSRHTRYPQCHPTPWRGFYILLDKNPATVAPRKVGGLQNVATTSGGESSDGGVHWQPVEWRGSINRGLIHGRGLNEALYPTLVKTCNILSLMKKKTDSVQYTAGVNIELSKKHLSQNFEQLFCCCTPMAYKW